MDSYKYTIDYCNSNEIAYDWKEDTVELCDTKYHSDWNWLIPVVKKLLQDTSNTRDKITPYMREMVKKDILNKLTDLEIKPLWNAVVEGIEVINSNKQ